MITLVVVIALSGVPAPKSPALELRALLAAQLVRHEPDQNRIESLRRQLAAIDSPPAAPRANAQLWRPLKRTSISRWLERDRSHQKVNGDTAFLLDDAGTSVAIVLKEAPTHAICGGTLVTSSKVVTAAHCFRYFDARGVFHELHREDLLVVFDAPRLRDAKALSPLSDLRWPTSYAPASLTDDVGILVLKDPVQRPTMALFGSGTVRHVPTNARLCGWGINASGKSDVLMCVDTALIPEGICRYVYGDDLTPHTTCASGSNDACPGDSGSALTVEVEGTLQLYGIASWGWTERYWLCRTPTNISGLDGYYPGVYTSLTGVLGKWVALELAFGPAAKP